MASEQPPRYNRNMRNATVHHWDDLLHLPGGVFHSAQALERCEILDIFAPPSETTGIDD